MLTANDIIHQEFKKKFNGYDPDEVRAYLNYLAESFEQLTRKNQELQDENKKLKEQVRDLLGRENLLKNTILSIQQWSEDVKEKAKKEAAIIVKEAELKADEILETARENRVKIKIEIEELKRERDKLLEDLELWLLRLERIKSGIRDKESKNDNVEVL